jgi:hypothetical protein
MGFKDIDPIRLFAERRWHERCFKCQKCSLAFARDKVPEAVRELPFCDSCAGDASKLICGGCSRFISESSFLKPKGIHKLYHVGCFKCDACGRAIESGFKTRGELVLCVEDGNKSQKVISEMIATRSEVKMDSSSVKKDSCPACGSAKASPASKFCGECGHKF